MSDSNSPISLRNIEFLSLVITVFGCPISFFLLGITILLIAFQNSNQIIGYFTAFSIVFVALIWDTKYFIGGIIFMPSFRNYLKHAESDEDRTRAKFSFFWSLTLILVVFSFIIYFLP